VIGGHGAFMIAIDDYEGFAEAIQRKLASEIAGFIPSRFATRELASSLLCPLDQSDSVRQCARARSLPPPPVR
jgi:hypothetical protein